MAVILWQVCQPIRDIAVVMGNVVILSSEGDVYKNIDFASGESNLKVTIQK